MAGEGGQLAHGTQGPHEVLPAGVSLSHIVHAPLLLLAIGLSLLHL